MSTTLVELKNVRKRYEDFASSPLVLDGVDASFKAGECAAIIGPSGCGKSTLLNIIGSLDFPSEGEVFFDGRNLAALDEKALAEIRNHKIGFVFQAHHLLAQCSVWENILMPTLAFPPKLGKTELKTRAQHLLERVEMWSHRNKKPGQLSGGECQRIAVVRALINSPRLLLADEPTGALDGKTAQGLMELLHGLNRDEQVALLVVTHSIEMAEGLGKIYKLADGKLAVAERVG